MITHPKILCIGRRSIQPSLDEDGKVAMTLLLQRGGEDRYLARPLLEPAQAVKLAKVLTALAKQAKARKG